MFGLKLRLGLARRRKIAATATGTPGKFDFSKTFQSGLMTLLLAEDF